LVQNWDRNWEIYCDVDWDLDHLNLDKIMFSQSVTSATDGVELELDQIKVNPISCFFLVFSDTILTLKGLRH
jgi:hypothetical protein